MQGERRAQRQSGEPFHPPPGRKPVRPAGAALALFLLALPGAARAADEEIQVYMDEMNRKGLFGLDLHLNYVPRGRRADVDYAGEEASDRRLRITPEFSYGLTPSLELGLYLPLMEVDRAGRLEVGGAKARLKYIAPHDEKAGFFWGANFELGRVRRRLDVNPWNAEAKAIAGWRRGRWTLAGNLNFDFTVSGPATAPATFQLAAKAAYELKPGFSLGLESYSDLGDTSRLRLDGRGNHAIYAVIDKNFGRFDLDLGIGRGYGRPEDKWVVKAIIGIPIDPRGR
jgi:hypothetical protein